MVMIGERLAEIRKDYGDTQATLASRLNVSLSSVRSWEQEKSSPPHEMLVTICKLYRVSADYLLGLSRERTLDISGLTEEEAEVVAALVQLLQKKER